MRFLILLVLFFWCVALLRRAFSWMLRSLFTAPQANSEPPHQAEDESALSSRRLVRDPVCGVHVAEVLAIPLREGGELVHFCSTECRDKYIAGEKKFAANG